MSRTIDRRHRHDPVEVARRGDYHELDPTHLAERDGYTVDTSTGMLYLSVRPGGTLTEGVHSFYVDDDGDDVVWLQPPGDGPATVADLDARDAHAQAEREAAEAQRVERLRAARRPVTLDDVRHHSPHNDLPTLAAAAATITDHQGDLTVDDGHLLISVALDEHAILPPGDGPATLARIIGAPTARALGALHRAQLLDAVIALHACEPVVVEHLAAGRALPDTPPPKPRDITPNGWPIR